MDSEGDQEVTGLLIRLSNGDKGAMAELMPRVYGELSRMAHNYMRRESRNHTLETGALINEAYLKLIDQDRVTWQNRNHFFGIAATVMRHILINHVKARRAQKRGGDAVRVPLDDFIHSFEEKKFDLIDLNFALIELKRLDPQQVSIVELRYFAGLTIEETAEALNIAPATVKRQWGMAKAWLLRAINRKL